MIKMPLETVKIMIIVMIMVKQLKQLNFQNICQLEADLNIQIMFV